MMADPDGSAGQSGERLARAVRTRLAELHVSGRALSRAGYLPSATLGRLLQGDSFPRRDLSDLERGLGWAKGSAYQVASGKEPTVILVPRGQPVRPGQAVVAWPLARDQAQSTGWRDVVEAAWKQVETAERADDHAGPSAGRSSWLRGRTAELPAWLAERIQAVLGTWEAQHGVDESPDVFALIDRIMGLDRARDVLSLLIEWRDDLRRGND